MLGFLCRPVRSCGENDRVTLRESEASLIRTAANDYLAHKRSMLRIAKDWNTANVKTDGMLPDKQTLQKATLFGSERVATA